MPEAKALVRDLLAQAIALLDGQPPAPGDRHPTGRTGPGQTVADGTGGPKARFGKCRGMALSLISAHELDWYSTALQRSIDDPTKDRFLQSNAAELSEVLSEKARRGGAASETPSVPTPGADDDLPFAVPFDVAPDHARRVAKWERW